MKHKLFSLLLCLLLLPTMVVAQDFVNLTPRPKTMTVKTGSLKLPNEFVVGYPKMSEAMVAEVNRFVKDFNAVSGFKATCAENQENALFSIQLLPASNRQKPGAYLLSVTGDKVLIKAKDELGLYYAFQSIKKILPPHVMAGVKDAKVKDYVLPFVTINDEPRYEYRGFMLDVSRHFFDVKEIKRILDVMSYYKMNRFHWHLSDDQGWRVEIKKYPKLTTVGSIAPNSRFTDMYTCTQYWINKPYGPYFYTQEEIKDVVAYAKERHIEIIPEIDMPGHFVAALASYPEFSCDPEGSHIIWTDGGISEDVMNVANPKAVQFTKDILAELIELFPYDVIHIGGDECPTKAWENNKQCQERYKELGLTNYRQLQSHFIKDMADFVQSKGRHLAVWNEAITANSADVQTVKSCDPIVYCWTGPHEAAAKAKKLGLKNIYTPWGPYYINRRQGNGPLDPPGAGYGTDDVRATYNEVPPTETDYGVQGTFWTEHVSDRDYMEWLALPRLIAIAEAGWTPQNRKDFSDFQKRMSADTLLLNYGDYRYCKYHMLDAEEGGETPEKVMPKVNTAEKKYYYRMVVGSTDANRVNRCVELLSKESPIVSAEASHNAAAGRLWSNAQAKSGEANYDYQWWSLEEDPAAPGKYALVCKARPEGSLNPTPTANNNTGRWEYDETAKHYNFILGERAYGQRDGGYFYSVQSDKVDGQFMNCAMGGQGFAINLWNNPSDAGGGEWLFAPMENYDGGETPDPAKTAPLKNGKTYVFVNTVEGFDSTMISDNGKSKGLQHTTDVYGPNVWTVTECNTAADGTQTFKMQNENSKRCIASAAGYVGLKGFPVVMGNTSATLKLTYDAANKDYRILVNNRSLFPLPEGTVNSGSTIKDAKYDAPRLQGAAWGIREVNVVTFNCVDDKGQSLGTFKRGVDVKVAEVTKELCPVLKNAEVQTLEKTGENTYKVVYKRMAYAVTLKCVDTKGAIVDMVEETVPVGESYTFKAPVFKYYEYVESELKEGAAVQLVEDMSYVLVYKTNAFSGVKKLGQPVTSKLENGKSYVLFDASPAENNARQGYRRIMDESKVINRYARPENMDPSAVWTLEATGSQFKVKNEYHELYVPVLKRSKAAVASAEGGVFTFKLNSGEDTWNIKCANGQYWDGLGNGDLVGWDGGTGHPIRIYEYYAQPYYTVNVTYVDEKGKSLGSDKALLPAGSAYPLVFPEVEGYSVSKVEGNENYEGSVEDFLVVKVTYAPQTPDGIDNVEIAAEAEGNQGIYDLQGRRLQRIAHSGLYIVNGRKVLVK